MEFDVRVAVSLTYRWDRKLWSSKIWGAHGPDVVKTEVLASRWSEVGAVVYFS
jgi:hypothetical protein